MALSLGVHRAIRIVLALVFAAGIGLAMHRLHRSDEQAELTRYVEQELPSMLDEERAITDSIASLLDEKKATPEQARKRLAEDIQPRLVHLRRRAESLQPKTLTVRQLAAAYLVVLDAWTEAVRAAIRAIDDPKMTTEAGLAIVRERLAEAARADSDWRDRLVRTCEHNRLTAPRR